MGVFTSIPAFVNAHTHSPFGPQFNGVLAAQPEQYLQEMLAFFTT